MESRGPGPIFAGHGYPVAPASPDTVTTAASADRSAAGVCPTGGSEQVAEAIQAAPAEEEDDRHAAELERYRSLVDG